MRTPLALGFVFTLGCLAGCGDINGQDEAVEADSANGLAGTYQYGSAKIGEFALLTLEPLGRNRVAGNFVGDLRSLRHNSFLTHHGRSPNATSDIRHVEGLYSFPKSGFIRLVENNGALIGTNDGWAFSSTASGLRLTGGLGHDYTMARTAASPRIGSGIPNAVKPILANEWPDGTRGIDWNNDDTYDAFEVDQQGPASVYPDAVKQVLGSENDFVLNFDEPNFHAARSFWAGVNASAPPSPSTSTS